MSIALLKRANKTPFKDREIKHDGQSLEKTEDVNPLNTSTFDVEAVRESYKFRRRIGDPLTMYLASLEGLPLFNHEQEIALGKRIERNRVAFMQGVVGCCDLSIILVRDHIQNLTTRKEQIKNFLNCGKADTSKYEIILKKLTTNLDSIKGIFERSYLSARVVLSRNWANKIPHNELTSDTADTDLQTDNLGNSDNPNLSTNKEQRILAWRMIEHHRRNAAKLALEVPFHLNIIENIFNRLEKISKEMTRLSGIVRKGSSQEDPEIIEGAKRKLNSLIRVCGVTSPILERKIEKLREFHDELKVAKKELCEGNLRLVVNIAKGYRKRGIPFIDLIEEGNAGLLRSLDKWDWKLGYRFSTYATFWIRQSILKAIEDQSRTIRVPAHKNPTLHTIRLTEMQLQGEIGFKPTNEEIAERAKIPLEVVESLRPFVKSPTSLDLLIGEGGSSMRDLIEANKETPQEERDVLQKVLSEKLKTLNDRQRMVIEFRFGFIDGKIYTLEEVAQILSITRERVRQIQEKAIKKLASHQNMQNLRCFTES